MALPSQLSLKLSPLALQLRRLLHDLREMLERRERTVVVQIVS